MSRDLDPGPQKVNTRSGPPSGRGNNLSTRSAILDWLPIPGFLVVIVILSALKITTRFDPAYLIMSLNIIFLTMVSVFVAFLAAKTYLVRGELAVMLFGCGMWIYGIAWGIAGVLDYLDFDAHLVTVHNCGAFLAGLCVLASALLAMIVADDKPPAGPALILPLIYLVGLGMIILITVGALEGFIPPFFKPGTGATPVRQAVLIAACLQFVVSSILFGTLCRRSATSFPRWYAMGLALIAIGLLGVFPQTQLGTPLNWAARLAQYLGEVYILYAAFSAFRQYNSWGIPIGRAFQELENRYRNLVEMCPDAILVHSEGRYIYANPAAVRLFGARSPEDLIGRVVIDLVDPAFRGLGSKRIQQAYEGAVTPLQEFKLIRLDGQGIDVQTTDSPVEFGGRPAIQSVVRDVTERKRAEELLRESEDRLRFALESSEMGFWDMDLVDHSTHRSLRHDQIFGYKELLPLWTFEMFLEHVLPQDREGVEQKYRRAIDEQRDWDFECRILRCDQTVRWIWACGRLQKDESGKPKRIAGIVQDVTARKQAEEALRRSESLYRAIGESIDYGVWVCAPDGRNIYASESFLKMVGLTQEQCSDFGWGNVLHPEDAERTIAGWKECVRTGGTWDIEHRFRGVDGNWHAVLARGMPVHNEQGEITCWAGINLDISRLKAAEEALHVAMTELDRRVQKRTEELSRTIDALQIEVAQRTLAEQALLDRSEKLRLLTSELALAEQRERQRLAQVLHDGLQQILVCAKIRVAVARQPGGRDLHEIAAELESLIDEAIATSRSLTAELSPPILQEFGLVPALEWLARWMRENHGLTLDIEANAQSEPAEEDIRTLLFQATRELLLNVVKHAGVKTGCVQLSRQNSRVLLAVTDAGRGFDPIQVHSTGDSTGGFGLFSIRERIHLLGGEMVIDSMPGKGSRIILAVPSAAVKDGGKTASAEHDSLISEGIPPRQKAPVAHVDNRIRIVLVDDHAVMRQGLARLLRETPDMEIVGEASDGEAAVNLVRKTLPHVVLMDISIPGMNGIQATRIIHSEHPQIRIIGLSMFEEDEQATAIRAAGAVDYLTKSGPADAIIRVVRAWGTHSGDKASTAANTGRSQ